MVHAGPLCSARREQGNDEALRGECDRGGGRACRDRAGAVGAAHADATAESAAANVGGGTGTPFHYATGDHLKPGQSQPRRGIYGPGYGRIVYVVGDSMAGQLSDPTRTVAERRGWRIAPRTKSGTSFVYPDTSDTETGRWRRAVYEELKLRADTQRYKPMVIVAGQNPGTTTTLRRTVWHLRNAGVGVRLATSSPFPSTDRPGANFKVVNPGPGRWATKKVGSDVSVSVLDVKPLAARPVGGGWNAGTVKGANVYRGAGSHLSVGFTTKVLTWHVDRRL